MLCKINFYRLNMYLCIFVFELLVIDTYSRTSPIPSISNYKLFQLYNNQIITGTYT